MATEMTPRRATRGEWADKIANNAFKKAGGALFNGDVQAVLKAEHARAVRIVKAEIKRVTLDQHTYNYSSERMAALNALKTVMNKLTRGR